MQICTHDFGHNISVESVSDKSSGETLHSLNIFLFLHNTRINNFQLKIKLKCIPNHDYVNVVRLVLETVFICFQTFILQEAREMHHKYSIRSVRIWCGLGHQELWLLYNLTYSLTILVCLCLLYPLYTKLNF